MAGFVFHVIVSSSEYSYSCLLLQTLPLVFINILMGLIVCMVKARVSAQFYVFVTFTVCIRASE